MLFICLFLNVPVVLHPWKFWNVNNLWEASSALSLCSLPRNVTNNTSILFIRSGPCLILLSSLVFLSCAIPILLILNFFASCVFDWVVARKTTSELKSLVKAAVFFREPLWNSKSACCLCFFFFVPQEKRCRNYVPCRLISASHNLFEAPIKAGPGHRDTWRATLSQSDSVNGFTLMKLSCENCFFNGYQMLAEFVRRHLALSDCSESFYVLRVCH